MPFSTFISSSSPPTRSLVPDHDVEDAGEHDAATESAGARGRRGRRGPILLALVVGSCGGCGDVVDQVRARFGELGGPSGEGSESPAAKSPATLSLDLVPGIEVSIDDAVVGQTPLAPITVPPGRHQVTLTHRCATNPATLSLDLESGETRTVTTADSGLPEPATLKLALSALHGQPLAPRVWISEPDRGDLGVEVEHALVDGHSQVFGGCRQRLRIESGHPDVGGYWEDVSFASGETLARAIVLAPGPDIVRLPGDDRFLAGMRPEDEALTEEDDEIYPRHEVKIAPFELDRSPVTAAQWSACRSSGGCKDTEFDSSNAPAELSACAVDPYRKRSIKNGASKHAMNCSARYEAERYCAWAGKRLPTIEEYEYAARSGRSDAKCPWGGGTELPLCSRRADVPTHDTDVCSFSQDNSSQGICDLVWMREYAADTRPPGAGRCDDFTYAAGTLREGPTVGGPHPPWLPPGCNSHAERFVGVTFRCARDVKSMVEESPR